MSGLTHQVGGVPVYNEVTTYGYDAAGNQDWMCMTKWYNGTAYVVVTDYVYDALNRLTELDQFRNMDTNKVYNSGTDTLLARYVYTLREDGNRTQDVETNSTADTSVFTWAYDALGRLSEEGYDGPAGDYTTDYAFDVVGNRMKETKLSGGVTATTAYTYDRNNRLLTEALDDDGDLAVEKTTRYEYGPDADPANGVGGNWTMLTKETAWSAGGAQLSEVDYTYDAQGRLKTVATDSNYNGYVEVMDTYGYDENGIRVSKETWQNEADDGDPGEYHTYKTRFLIDNNNATGYAQVLEEWNASGMGALSRWYVIGQ